MMLAGACGSDDVSGGTDAGTSGAAGVAGAGAEKAGPVDQGDVRKNCASGLPGPALVGVPTPPGSPVANYCMDATEVTNAQYAEFLAAGISTSEGLPECGSQLVPFFTHVPFYGWPPAPGTENHPIHVADWCDAYAYCAWAGKRLCGRIGGGVNQLDDYADATKSEWYNACSAGGTRMYPYGDAWVADACHRPTRENGGLAAVGSKPACEGGYAGLFDLSGNADEWENSCSGTTDGTDTCRIRGIGLLNAFDETALAPDGAKFACAYSTINTLLMPSFIKGFRCCADALE
jgi:formylglycine-generating enzyme required for sulfatase activity